MFEKILISIGGVSPAVFPRAEESEADLDMPGEQLLYGEQGGLGPLLTLAHHPPVPGEEGSMVSGQLWSISGLNQI